jgi:hypothetical protein
MLDPPAPVAGEAGAERLDGGQELLRWLRRDGVDRYLHVRRRHGLHLRAQLLVGEEASPRCRRVAVVVLQPGAARAERPSE